MLKNRDERSFLGFFWPFSLLLRFSREIKIFSCINAWPWDFILFSVVVRGIMMERNHHLFTGLFREVLLDGRVLWINRMNFDSKRNFSADLHFKEHWNIVRGWIHKALNGHWLHVNGFWWFMNERNWIKFFFCSSFQRQLEDVLTNFSWRKEIRNENRQEKHHQGDSISSTNYFEKKTKIPFPTDKK